MKTDGIHAADCILEIRLPSIYGSSYRHSQRWYNYDDIERQGEAISDAWFLETQWNLRDRDCSRKLPCLDDCSILLFGLRNQLFRGKLHS